LMFKDYLGKIVAGSSELFVIAKCINGSKTIGNGCIHCLHSCVWGRSIFSPSWRASGILPIILFEDFNF
jgi:hypothetical protein